MERERERERDKERERQRKREGKIGSDRECEEMRLKYRVGNLDAFDSLK